MNRSIVCWILGLAAMAAASCGRFRPEASPKTVQTLQQRVESKSLPAYVSSDDSGPHLWKAERRF